MQRLGKRPDGSDRYRVFASCIFSTFCCASFDTTLQLFYVECFDGLRKDFHERHEVSGHDFSRADERNKMCGALQAAEKLDEGAVLKGHEFTRADNAFKLRGALELIRK